MKKTMIPGLITAMIITSFMAASCSNNSGKVGAIGDSSLVSPPMQKTQDTTSLTDTSYRIGDSVR